jgi:glycosyltransferase involved in cell wall biosynthesis
MRIAQVAPLIESVPPVLYGGTERVVSYLTEELVRQGHEVTLFASGGSITAARLISPCPIEAMACGTPVVAFRCGSVPEIIEDGTTRYIVDSCEEAAKVLQEIPRLSRRRIRKRFETRFSVERMARDYVAIYEQLPSEVRDLQFQ